MRKEIAAAFAAASFTAPFAGCVSMDSGTAVAVPDNLKAPAGETLSLETRATGMQIYECNASKADPARFEWVFKAPEAELFDTSGNRVGKHYAGPSWEANDGSKVVGDLKARDDGPDASAIPWLLLTAKSNSGTGLFGQTRTIQRVSTVGGKAPASGCDRSQAGKEARVPYKAVYYFYGPAR
jgi:hypothetical protein